MSEITTKDYRIEMKSGWANEAENIKEILNCSSRTYDGNVKSVTELPVKSDIPPTAVNFTIENKYGKVHRGFLLLYENKLYYRRSDFCTSSIISVKKLIPHGFNILTLKCDDNINHPNFAEAKKQIEEMQEKARREKRGPRPELITFTFWSQVDGEWNGGIIIKNSDNFLLFGNKRARWNLQEVRDCHNPTDFKCSDKSALPKELIDYLDETGGWADEL